METFLKALQRIPERYVAYSVSQWKLVLIKDNGDKIIRYCSSKKNGLAVGRMIHGAKTRPTKMFSVTKA